MKILYFSIIGASVITVIVGIAFFTLAHNPPTCTFCPSIPSPVSNSHHEPVNTTIISSVVFPTSTMYSFDGMSVKGYLTDQNGIGLANHEIVFYITNATLDNGTTISENLLMGKTTTNQDGCFYFADWDANKSLQFRKDVFTRGSDNAPTHINTVFGGTKNLSSSSNVTTIMYHPIVAPIIREGINAFLLNSSSLGFINSSSLELERGNSYNFKVYPTWSELFKVQTMNVEIKNLPCGINVPSAYDSDLSNKSQVIIPVTMTIDKTAPIGSFDTFVSINNRALQPIHLVIK